VRNLSDGGARLQVQSTFGLPSTFELAFDETPPRACKVVWLDATTLRVQFQEAGAPARNGVAIAPDR
jgi:hypothetical protein